MTGTMSAQRFRAPGAFGVRHDISAPAATKGDVPSCAHSMLFGFQRRLTGGAGPIEFMSHAAVFQRRVRES
ncbi:MAG: hypothetical protein B7Z55_00700 [Planctomycetales bacterium 12-60-4]|nr:MAG: hypothetical protein B7Z55_00700 [Planctomycetales bacterium 12-60-4]